jgi:hypothetical protein
MNIVTLRPVRRDHWSNVIKYKNCHEDLAPYYTRSGRIYTGLTTNDEERLGKALSTDLSSNSDFWKNFFIRTGAKDILLDLEDPFDEVKYLFLKNHKRVKNSILEKKATANFVLINENEEAKRDNIYNRIKREAVKAFDSMSVTDMRKALRLFGENADDAANEVVENRLYSIVEGNAEKFLEKWVHNVHKDTDFILESAISKNIIRKNKNIYRYGSDIIGNSKEEAIMFLEDLKNQDIKIAIKRAIESKTYIDSSSSIPQKDNTFESFAAKLIKEAEQEEEESKSIVTELLEQELKKESKQKSK